MIRHAIVSLGLYPKEDPEGLHEARKDIKKIRSVLRLLRHPEAREERNRLNRELREIALLLADRRDGEVLAGILEKWIQKMDKSEDPVLHQAIAKLLHSFTDNGASQPPLHPAVQDDFRKRLLAVREAIEELPLEFVSRKRIKQSALVRQSRMESAYLGYLREPNAEALHTWRKRLKEHMHHLELLKKLHRSKRKTRMKIGKLEQYLGNSRDYDLLLEAIRHGADAGLSAQELASLAQQAEGRQSRCLKKALRLAEKYCRSAGNRPARNTWEQ